MKNNNKKAQNRTSKGKLVQVTEVLHIFTRMMDDHLSQLCGPPHPPLPPQAPLFFSLLRKTATSDTSNSTEQNNPSCSGKQGFLFL